MGVIIDNLALGHTLHGYQIHKELAMSNGAVAPSLVRTRQEAIALGHKRYFTNKPCKYGHTTERSIDGKCLGCRRIASRKWTRADRIKNPDKHRAKGRRLFHAHAEARRAHYREWYAKNRKEQRARCKTYRSANQ